MIELIKWLHDLIRDKGTKWFTKSFLILSILFVIYIVDDYYGWSYYSQTSNKVELLKNINECLKDTTINTKEKEFLISEKSKLLSRKTIPNIFFDYSESMLNRNFEQKDILQNFKFEFLNGKEVIPIYRFFLINFGAFALCLVEVVKILRLNKSRSRKILAIILLIIAFSVVALFYTFILSLIPVIWKNNIWINYVIYFIVGIINTRQFITEQKKGSFKKLIID